ncbi:hypothetical protein CAEBREN_00070 [Caenorhabditis brenneri]|uniref:Uncharacterized protein n=1 Tax=Caenorhabditis brenneri TaxID=135651 RepID=G0N4C7_CAEBE|nr:hypothetical protein CAEBREN_00070 [Caenorhabditis brenneri]
MFQIAFLLRYTSFSRDPTMSSLS